MALDEMTSTEETVRALRVKITQATAERARAQAEHDRAVQDRDAALVGLKEFGVSTSEEAAAYLQVLETELADALAEVEAALAETGA